MKKSFAFALVLLLAVSLLAGCGKNKDPEAALGANVTYEEYVIEDLIVASIPSTLDVENPGYGYITITKKGETWDLLLGRGFFKDDTSEATWEASKALFESIYSGVKEITVSGKKGIYFDAGAALSVHVPIDDEHAMYMTLRKADDSAADRLKIFNTPEIQVILKKMVF